ncbi:MAG: nitroreductase family protein [Elusimicrobiota bacterium]|jgi:nitroreductase|nr:nitroreductase family protein [Elusimicrobiota bacterium]
MDILLERKSIRKYVKGNVKDKDLEYILRAAMSAPSAAHMRPWQFIVVKNKDIHEKIAEIHPYSKMILSAPLAILVVGDESKALGNYFAQDCAAASQNILLAATAKKYGAVWCGIYGDKERQNKFIKLFNLPKNIKPFSLIVIGKPDDNSKQKDRFESKKVKYEVWK